MALPVPQAGNLLNRTAAYGLAGSRVTCGGPGGHASSSRVNEKAAVDVFEDVKVTVNEFFQLTTGEGTVRNRRAPVVFRDKRYDFVHFIHPAGLKICSDSEEHP